MNNADPNDIQDFMNLVKPVKTEHSLIRVGGDSDGGYLIPDDLDGVKYCFSPGVSRIARFEEALIEQGVKCFLADNSVDHPPFTDDMIVFDKKHLGLKNDSDHITLQDWVESKCSDNGKDLILQMDIEGSEYDVLSVTPSSVLKMFRIIIVEFHMLRNLVFEYHLTRFKEALEKLTDDFHVVHLHPNNCSPAIEYEGFTIPPVMEITFLRKDRAHSLVPIENYPNPLDRPNVKRLPDIPLPSCWYK